MMKSRSKKHMGLLYVMLGGIFLCNPVVGFVDVLPDLVGCLLISVGLLRLADLNGHILESAQRFRVMLFVGVGQLLAQYLIHVSMQSRIEEMNRYEQPVTILLCSFVVLVLQWYFLIPALRHLFLGLDQLTERHGNVALSREKDGKTAGERMARLSAVFVVISSLCSFLPEMTVLTSFEHDAESEIFTFDWYDFVALFRLLGTVLCLIVALIWLVSFLRYFKRVLEDREWLSRLWDTYAAEILPQTGMLTARRFSLAFLLFQVAMVFTVSLRLNSYVALPSAVCAILILISVRHLGDLVKEKRQCYTACVVLILASLAHLLASTTYLAKFLPEASLYQGDAYRHFLAVRLTGILEAVCTLIAVAALLKLMHGLILEHVSVDYCGGAHATAVSADATARLHRELEKRLIVIFVFFFLAAIANALDAFYQLEFPWIWLIGLVLSIAGIWNFSSMLHELLIQLRNRYH